VGERIVSPMCITAIPHANFGESFAKSSGIFILGVDDT